MVVKNNYYWVREYPGLEFIANGDIAEIIRIKKYEELYNYKFADVVLQFVDYNMLEIEAKINLGTMYINSASLDVNESREFYNNVAEDYIDIKSKRKKYELIRENPYFNALQVKFAYAITCHKAQGGQWKVVFIDQGFLPKNFPDIEFLKWLYTAITRATEKIYLVNFSEKFF